MTEITPDEQVPQPATAGLVTGGAEQPAPEPRLPQMVAQRREQLRQQAEAISSNQYTLSDSQIAGAVANLLRLRLNPDGLNTHESVVLVALQELLERRRTDETKLPQPSETGWLVETPINGAPHWYSFSADRYWTKDANEATRFAREEDADSVIAHYGLVDARATGHEWVASGQKAEPTQHQHWCRSNEFHGLAKDRECNCGAVNGKPQP